MGGPDERPPTPEEAEVYRRLVREFRDNGGGTLLNFALNGDARFPHEYDTVQSLVSRFFRWVELGVLVESGETGFIAKMREVGEGLFRAVQVNQGKPAGDEFGIGEIGAFAHAVGTGEGAPALLRRKLVREPCCASGLRASLLARGAALLPCTSSGLLARTAASRRRTCSVCCA